MMNSRLYFHRKPKLPMILQDETAECGHACIAMIGQFLGHRIDLGELRKINQPSTRGVTLRHLNQLCEQLKLKTRALRVSLTDLRFVKKPAILHWNMNHFVVLKQVKKNKLIIHDPAIGVRTCHVDECNQSFTGVVLEVETSHDFQPIRAQQRLGWSDLIRTVSGIRRIVGLILLLSFAIELFTLLNPLFIQYITDQVLGTTGINHLYIIATGCVLLLLLHALAEYSRGHLMLYASIHFTETLGSNVFKHLLSLPTSFFEARQHGDLQSKFQTINHIQTKISSDFIHAILDGSFILIHLIVMLLYSPILTAIVMSTLTLYIGLRYASYQSFKHHTASSIYLHAKVETTFLDTLRAITPIKLFLKESMRFNIWRNNYIDALNADIQVATKQIMYRVANHVLFNLELIIVLCVGAQRVLAQQFSVGMLVAFLAYRLMLVNKSSSFIQHIIDFQLISIQFNRLGDILFQQPEQAHTDISYSSTIQAPLSLSLQDISFRYNAADHCIFNQLTLTINAGEKIAITGASGCGKSTLLRIMMGLLHPTSGKIEVNGIPLSQFGLNHYRSLTAAVMQQDSLLSGSILDNITFFDENIDLDYVHHVATLAQIHETVTQLPMGYETLVSDMGLTLSGGQRQRLLLARALYKKPHILFLDEATSHLDSANEQWINQALTTLPMTQIIVAHREETIKMADRVIDLMQYP